MQKRLFEVKFRYTGVGKIQQRDIVLAWTQDHAIEIVKANYIRARSFRVKQVQP